MRLGSIIGLVVLALGAATQVYAQLAAQINGTITDISGGMVLGAQVTLENLDTAVRAETKSNSVGYYVFPVLQPGRYLLIVETAGFKTARRTGITLQVAQTAKIDFNLEPGEITQSVDVSASAELLDVGVSAIGQAVGTRSVANLPTNGRNSYSFIALVPGVRAPAGFQQTQIDNVSSAFVSINGARPNQSVFYLDGGTNTQGNFNGPTYTPSLDVVEEFKVQTNNFGAEYTNTAGGVVNLVTKSGTNAFHGTLYEFLRNDALDANDFFLNRSGQKKPEYRFNQFGGTLGGPVVKNRTFFFFGYEGLRLIRGATYTNTMPTALQRAGDFSATRNAAGQMIAIYDALTSRPDPDRPGQNIRSPFAGNRVPRERYDPVAANLLKYIPDPNNPGNPVTGNNNFVVNTSAPTDKNDYSIRLDHHISPKTTLFGRYSYNRTLWNMPWAYGQDNPASPQLGDTTFDRYATVINATHIFSPAFLMDASASFNRWHQTRVGPGVGFDPTQLGMSPSVVQHSARGDFPVVNVAGMAGVSSVPNTFNPGLLAAGGTVNGINGFDRFENRVNFTYVRGRHTLRFGALYGVPRSGTGGWNTNGGSYTFNQGFTQGPNPFVASGTAGIGFASFLLGYAAAGTHPTGQVGENVINKYYGGYVQEDFKVTSKLTLNFGLRYDYNTPFTERFNALVNFDRAGKASLKGVDVTGGLQFVGIEGRSRYNTAPDRRDWAPRAGFSYSPNNRTVFRGGYGIFFGQLTGGGFNNAAIPNTGYTCSTTMPASADGGLTPLARLSNPFPTGFCAAPGNTLGLLTNLGQDLNITDGHNRLPYSQQWSINIQRQLPWKLVAEAGYSGNRGLRLSGDLLWNQMPSEQLALGSQLQRVVANPYASIVPTGGLSLPTVTQAQLLRPYPQFLQIVARATDYGASSYNALQSKLEKRLSHGLTFLASYTWSKIIDDVPASTVGFPGGTFAGAGLQDYNNRRQERALAAFDTPHNFVASAVGELPFGDGKALLNRRGILDKIVGSWQLNGILTMQSGTPVMIVGGNASQAFAGTQRPNWSGQDPNLSGSITSRLNRYFNTSVFSFNAPYTFGNAPRLMPSLGAPGAKNLDMSLLKMFTVTERVRVQFRAEFFNIMNRAQFGFPDGSINSTNFGTINSQVNNPRDIQFALKVLF